MSDPSFERFDYQLRSNKHIERKLIFDLLLRAKKRFSFDQHKYLGLGSMWFADHRLAHRLLGIKSLISFEDGEYAERAEFNKPYGSVTVTPGMSYEILPNWNKEDWSAPIIVWMDYDGLLEETSVEDLTLFAQNLQPNSIILVSVNANQSNYKVRKELADAAARRGETVDRRSIGTLEKLLGKVIPAKYKGTEQPADVKANDFPQCLAETLLAFLNHKVTSSGRQINNQLLRFVPLFNFCHKDGVEMVTVGGAICDAESERGWRDTLLEEPMLARPETGLPLHHRLDLKPITLREKLLLDSILPNDKERFSELFQNSGLKLGIEHAEKYRQHYRHFPMFVETPI